MRAYISYTVLTTIDDVKGYNDAEVKAVDFAMKEGFYPILNDIDIYIEED